MIKQKIYLAKPLRAGNYLGLDLATKCGWAYVTSDGTKTYLVDYGSIALSKKMVKLGKVVTMGNMLEPVIKKYASQSTVVIENCYLGPNAGTYAYLNSLQGCVAHIINGYTPKIPKLIYPSSARKRVGINTHNLQSYKLKALLVEEVNKMLRQPLFKQVHDNIADAIILAIAGGM